MALAIERERERTLSGGLERACPNDGEPYHVGSQLLQLGMRTLVIKFYVSLEMSGCWRMSQKFDRQLIGMCRIFTVKR